MTPRMPSADVRPASTVGAGYVRFAVSAALVLVAVLAGHVALERGWFELERSTAFLLRGFAAATAVGIGLVNLARYFGRRDAASLIVGAAFTGMGLLFVVRITLHVVAVLVDDAYFETTFRLLWAHQMFLPLALLLGMMLVPLDRERGVGRRGDARFLGVAGLLALVALVGVWSPAFPGGTIPDTLVARPSAGWLVSAYLVLLVLMWRRPDVTGTPEGRWLAFALYVGFLNAALISPFWQGMGVAPALLDAATTLLMLVVAGCGTLIGMVRQARAEGALVEALRREAAERERIEAALAREAARLESANEELAQYAYLASHDLQEPLRMVTNYLQLIERRYEHVLDDDGREFMGYAVDGAVRMKRLTNDLLAYSQVSSQRFTTGPTDTLAAFTAARDNLELAIADAGGEVTHGPLPHVEMDSVRLVQLFQNLIANALKFRREGVAPHVHVSALQEGDMWRFTVRDDGIGIDAAYFDKVFGVFQRLHRSDVYPGSGIGLAICRKIVERHGGAIWLESTVGEGTAVHFTVPVDPERARGRVEADPVDEALDRDVSTLIDRARELL